MEGTQGTTEEGTEKRNRSVARSGPFGGLDAAEAGRASGRARREAAERRKAEVDEARLTARQRLGLALSELTLEDMRGIVKALALKAAHGDEKATHALARLLDQSFGRATPSEDEGGTGMEEWEAMSPAQRSAARARILKELREDGSPAGDPSDPRAGDPPAA